MEALPANNCEIRNTNRQIYFLATIFILSSSTQWCLLKNFKFFKFFLNPWLLSGAFITFILITTILYVMNLIDKHLPAPLDWIFGILLVEILVIILSHTVYYVDYNVVYIFLTVIILCMAILLTFGAKINADYLPTIGLVMYFLNMLLLILILILMMISKFLIEFYTIAFFMVLAIALPILIMNIIYVSMLISHDSYRTKTLTDCLKPALYIYGIFSALVWFSVALGIHLALS